MKIGIDISQLAFENTGVALYLKNLVTALLQVDKTNSYVLFFSSLRKKLDVSLFKDIKNTNTEIKIFHFPPTLLDLLWNKLHVFPIENLIGDVDVFITSDWTEPPCLKAKKATIIYDLIVYKYPKETAVKIIETQKRKWEWAKNEAEVVFCISESTKKDAQKVLGMEES
ncbi:hypothetical protein HY030_01105 [Candidatus Gottesmanbacteria bacterium]|nr:hypothetical protein [Candidatus Gottesmanbacteria bacterium]